MISRLEESKVASSEMYCDCKFLLVNLVSEIESQCLISVAECGRESNPFFSFEDKRGWRMGDSMKTGGTSQITSKEHNLW